MTWDCTLFVKIIVRKIFRSQEANPPPPDKWSKLGWKGGDINHGITPLSWWHTWSLAGLKEVATPRKWTSIRDYRYPCAWLTCTRNCGLLPVLANIWLKCSCIGLDALSKPIAAQCPPSHWVLSCSVWGRFSSWNFYLGQAGPQGHTLPWQ